MSEATQGDRVRVHYTGRLDDGTVFDSSEGRDPLVFELGEGRVIPGFEAAVLGMSAGDRKSTTIPSDEAYGPRRDDLLLAVERDRLPDGLDPEPGQALQMQTEEGQVVPVRVVEADDTSVTIDANHPLAGQDLTFEIELVGIE